MSLSRFQLFPKRGSAKATMSSSTVIRRFSDIVHPGQYVVEAKIIDIKYGVYDVRSLTLSRERETVFASLGLPSYESSTFVWTQVN